MTTRVKSRGKQAGFSRVKHKTESRTSGEEALTYSQVQTLLSRTDISLFDEALLRLALDGGLRRIDCVRVRCANLNVQDNHLIYWEQKKRRNWQCFLEPPTVKALSQLIASSNSEWMFPASNPRRPISDRTAYNILHNNLKACGLPMRPFHALRATCIKLKQAAGWPPEMTARHTGDTIRVIQQHYLTPSLEEMRERVGETRIFTKQTKEGVQTPQHRDTEDKEGEYGVV